MALYRAGEARRSEPFTASEMLIRSRAWGWLWPAPEPVRRRELPRPRGGVRGGAPEGLSLECGVPFHTKRTQPKNAESRVNLI